MLDPSRLPLNAETVGFRKRMRQPVDEAAFNLELQRQTDCIKVRREEKETPITEVHVMGGQLFGIGGNSKTNEYARQQRQINGYPLRHFSASGPIILPSKHLDGLLQTPVNVGLTQYVPRGEGVVPGQYVSANGELNTTHMFAGFPEKKDMNRLMEETHADRQANLTLWQNKKSRAYQNHLAGVNNRVNEEQRQRNNGGRGQGQAAGAGYQPQAVYNARQPLQGQLLQNQAVLGQRLNMRQAQQMQTQFAAQLAAASPPTPGPRVVNFAPATVTQAAVVPPPSLYQRAAEISTSAMRRVRRAVGLTGNTPPVGSTPASVPAAAYASGSNTPYSAQSPGTGMTTGQSASTPGSGGLYQPSPGSAQKRSSRVLNLYSPGAAAVATQNVPVVDPDDDGGFLGGWF